MQVNRLPATLGVVLVLQAILDNLELQLSHGAHDATTIELIDEQLGHTLVHQLLQALLELLALHRVVVLDVFKEEWREAWQTAEVYLLSLRQGISYLENSVVRQTYNVARISLVDGALALRHKLGRRRETHGLVEAHVIIWLVAHKLARANLAEGNARTVVRVDVGGNLEDEACKLRLLRLHHSLLCLGRLWRRGNLHEAVQELLHTEVVQSRTEEHRSHLGGAIGLHLELWVHAVHQLQLLSQLVGLSLAHTLVELLALNVYSHLLGHTLLVRGEEVELMLVDVVHTLESGALTDRPTEWAHLDFELLLQLVEHVEWVATLTVHLVDEDDDRGVSHTAHLHQLSGLRLHTLGRVYHDDGGVYGCQGAVSVLGEVLVTRSIEDVHLVRLARLSIGQVVELHHGCRDRDSTLLLNVHPVAGGSLSYLIVLDGTCHLNLTSEEEEFLGQCCLTSIRVRNDGKCSSSLYFVHKYLIVTL